MQSQKKSIPTPWKVIRNSKEEGVLKAKILEAKHEVKLEFREGEEEGGKTKTFYFGSMDIYWNCTFFISFKIVLNAQKGETPRERRLCFSLTITLLIDHLIIATANFLPQSNACAAITLSKEKNLAQ